MNIAGTAGQPLIALCLIAGGAVEAILYFIASRLKTNAVLDQIISFFTTLTGAILYFALLFLLNSGEMRLYTLLCFLLGVVLGYRASARVCAALLSKKVDK